MRKDEELAERLLQFAVSIVHLCSELPQNNAGYHVSRRLLGSGTSPGANYEEARAAQSLADFISKISIVLKELKESRYWLCVILKVPLMKPERASSLFGECEELIAILGKSLSTARQSKKRSSADSPTRSLQ